MDSETDTAAILDVAHYTELARFGMAPYRGAYCARLKLTGGTTSGYFVETGDFDIAADTARYFRAHVYLGRDFTMAASDKFALFEFEAVADTTTEISAGLTNTAGVIEFWYNETIAAASASTIALGSLAAPGIPGSALGKWWTLELAIDLDDGGSNDGSIIGYVNGGPAGTTVGTLDQAAVVQLKVGAVGLDAGTRGTVLLDEIAFDDARIYPNKERFPQVFQVTKSEHVFLGPGWIESAALLSTTSTDTMLLYDTDRANVLDLQGFKVELNNAIHSSVAGPIYFYNGCYAVIAGTSPRGQVALLVGGDRKGVIGPTYYSERGIIMLGQSKMV